MKKLKFLVLALIVAAPIMVNAAEPTTVGNLSGLKDCVDVTGSICKLTADITDVNETILIDGGVSVTIDLNGFDITGKTTYTTELFKVSNGVLEVKDSSTGTKGTITAQGDVFYLQGNEVVGDSAIKAELTIAAGVNVLSKTSNCVYLRGDGVVLDVYGNLTAEGDFSVIQGNGTKTPTQDAGNTVINIYEGASVINTYEYTGSLVNPAIYHPQSGTLTVYGGTIKGVTGIEMRAGDLIVKGGIIEGTLDEVIAQANNNGPAVMGAGIAIAQHTTMQDVSIEITDGTVKGAVGLYENTLETPNDPVVVTLDVKGGNFISTVQGGNAVSSENKTGFITGGTYTGLVNESYVEDNENHGFVENENGEQILIDATELNALAKELEEKVGTEEKANQYTEESLNALLAVLEGMEAELDAVQSQEDLDAIVAKLAKAIDGLETKEEAAKREEEAKKEANPDTGDNIVTYAVIATISVLLVSISLILKKRYN